jgi:hypothetical protein
MRLIVMYVPVAGPMGCTQHIFTYATDHHQARPSTMCTSSKCNPKLCDTTTRQVVSPLNHHGKGNQKQTVCFMAWTNMGSSKQALPKSKETIKGHGCKTRSGLQSTKIAAVSNNGNNDDTDHDHAKATHLRWPVSKQKEAIIKNL